MNNHSQLSTLLYQVDNFIQNKNIRKDNYTPSQGYTTQQYKHSFSPFENTQSKQNTKILGKFDSKTEKKNAGREITSSIHKDRSISFGTTLHHGYSKY